MQPEGLFVSTENSRIHYHDVGAGIPVVLLHGGGPGVSGWENWGGVVPELARHYRIIVPDMPGFGRTELKPGVTLSMKLWVAELAAFLDGLDIGTAVLVGNSFGGGLSQAFTLRQGHRVRGLALMGTPAGHFTQTGTLREATDYTPSFDNMRSVLSQFPFDPSIVTDEMVNSRLEMSKRHPDNAAFKALMPPKPAPGEPATVRGVPLEQLATIRQPVLMLHGREDHVVPVEMAINAARAIPDAELHLFGSCGHWVQLERAEAFTLFLKDFIDRRVADKGSR